VRHLLCDTYVSRQLSLTIVVTYLGEPRRAGDPSRANANKQIICLDDRKQCRAWNKFVCVRLLDLYRGLKRIGSR